jgi:tetratricopeptide (TPR) repeat protein
MKRLQLASSGSIARLLQSAELAWRRKEFASSIEILERAARLDPANIAVWVQLGRVHGLNFDYAAAGQCLDKAVRVAANKAEALVAAGECAGDFRNPTLAERYFQQALNQNGISANDLAKAAAYYERTRRLEEARKLTERALGLDGSCAPALLVHARLDRQAGQMEDAEKFLQRALSQPDPGAPQSSARDTRIRVLYEMGNILDRQGRYDDAMQAFHQAKSMLRLHAAQQLFELKTMRERLVEMRSKVTKEMLQRWQDEGSALQPKRRLALLGGHPRSGTTLLEQVLDAHPEIVSAEESEIFHDIAYRPLMRALPDDSPVLAILEPATRDILEQSRNSYFQWMEKCLGQAVAGRLLIDKNPSYTFFVPHFVRIFPETRFLIALRDPRDVVLSCFMQAFVPLGQGNSAYLSLEQAVDEYVALMTTWRTVRPLMQNPWLEVRYEDMVEDLESVARRTLDFLGVPWDPQVLGFHEHARQKVVRSPTYADVTKPVYKGAVGRWRHYQKYFEPHLARLEPFVKELGY